MPAILPECLLVLPLKFIILDSFTENAFLATARFINSDTGSHWINVMQQYEFDFKVWFCATVWVAVDSFVYVSWVQSHKPEKQR